MVKLRNANYRLEGLIGYEHREMLKRLSDNTGVRPEAIVSFALQRFFELPEPTQIRRLIEYYQSLEALNLQLVHPT